MPRVLSRTTYGCPGCAEGLRSVSIADIGGASRHGRTMVGGTRKILCLRISVLALAVCPRAEAQTLPESLHQAVENNPALAVEAARLRASEAQLTIARAGGLPTLSIDASASYNFQPISLEFSTPRRNASSDAVLGVPLYQGGSVKHGVRAARWTLSGSEDQVKSATSALIASVGAAYVQLLAAREDLDISKQYVTEIETGLLATKRRFEAGE
jgi:outer membrane protein